MHERRNAQVDQTISVLQKSTDEFLRIRTTLFCCHIPAKRSHLCDFSAAFLLSKALQESLQQAGPFLRLFWRETSQDFRFTHSFSFAILSL